MSKSDKTDVQQEEVVRFSIRRLEPSIKKFLKIVQFDLERLQRHRENMTKFTHLEEWEALDKEQTNAVRTLQQIKANLREMEGARNKTSLEDLPLFDERVKETKANARRAVENFITMTNVEMDATGMESTICTKWSERVPESVECLSASEGGAAVCPYAPSSMPTQGNLAGPTESLTEDSQEKAQTQTLTLQTSLHAAPDHVFATASWEHLHESLADLSAMMSSFSTAVQVQGQSLDRIEDNVEQADANILEGTKHLAKGTKYKAALFPVTGALIGGVVGGPVGLLLGAKIGGLAAVGGGMAGFLGGQLLKKQKNRDTNVEMQNLKDRRSPSPPKLTCPDSSS